MNIPDKKQWGDLTVDPEVNYAYQLYGGLSIDEAGPHFVQNPIERASELRFAPFEIFKYYIFCFINFLTSPESAEESDAASVFLRLVRDMAQKYPAESARFFPKIEEGVDHVSNHQCFYDADINIYGSFARLREEIDLYISGASCKNREG